MRAWSLGLQQVRGPAVQRRPLRGKAGDRTTHRRGDGIGGGAVPIPGGEKGVGMGMDGWMMTV